MAVDTQQLANILSGVSMGSQGQLPQFMQLQGQQREQDDMRKRASQIAEQERLKTFYLDADAGVKLFDTGNVGAFKNLMTQRLKALQNFPDADPSDTQRWLQLADMYERGSKQAGEVLRGELGSYSDLGKAIGVIEVPEPEAYTLSPGQRRYQGGQVVAEAPASPETPTAKELLQIVTTDGQTMPIQYDSRGGGFLDMQGRPATLPPGSTVTRVGAPTGAVGDVIPATKDLQMREATGAVRSFNDTASRVAQMVAENPDINTFAARLGAMGSGAMQEAGAIARFMGVPRETFDPGAYQTTFKQMGIDNAAIQSLVTSLAFQAAAASGQSGRDISNRDVERFISQIGGSYSDPDAFLASLQETVTGVNRDFANRYQAIYQKPFEGDLGQPTIRAPQAQEGWRIVP